MLDKFKNDNVLLYFLTKNTWNLLDVESSQPHENLLTEKLIFNLFETSSFSPIIRFWRNSKSVILGRFQHPKLELNIDECFNNDVVILKRFTGGGAVYHDLGNLNWSFFLPKNVVSNISEAYRLCSLCIINGLNLLGVSAKYSPSNAIQISDSKISGLAGIIGERSILCHGTLLVTSDLNLLVKVLTPTNNSVNSSYLSSRKFVRSKISPVTNISDELDYALSMDVLKKCLIQGIENTFNIQLLHVPFSQMIQHSLPTS